MEKLNLLYSLESFDIIFSDFGRRASIRYLDLFSDLERKIIKKFLGDFPFFDEYRRVDYLLTGQLNFWKKEWLLPFWNENKPLNQSILAGFKKGIWVLELERYFWITLSHLSDLILSLNKKTRFILPCNTLSEVLEKMESIWKVSDKNFEEYLYKLFPKEKTIIKRLLLLKKSKLLKFYPLIRQIIYFLQKKGYDKIFLLGTSETIKQYCRVGENLGIDIEWLEEGENERKILDSIDQEKKHQLELKKKKGYFYLSACTDVEVDGWHDSLQLYVKVLMKEIYYPIIL